MKKNLLEEIDYYLELPINHKYCIHNDMLHTMYKYAFLSDEISQAYFEINYPKIAISYLKKSCRQIDLRIKQLIKKFRKISGYFLYDQDLKNLIIIYNSIISKLERYDVVLEENNK